MTQIYLTYPNSQLPAGKVSLSIHSPHVASGSPTRPVSPATPPTPGTVLAETILRLRFQLKVLSPPYCLPVRLPR